LSDFDPPNGDQIPEELSQPAMVRVTYEQRSDYLNCGSCRRGRGGNKLEKQTYNDDSRIEGMLNVCNCQIEELEACAKQASPELRKQCEEQISVLISNREALKRGLLKVSDERQLCSSCSEE